MPFSNPANEQEKNEINNILAENEKKYEEELREKYNPDNLFKKKENKQEEKVEEQHSLMVVENKPWYKKIFEKIKNIFENLHIKESEYILKQIKIKGIDKHFYLLFVPIIRDTDFVYPKCKFVDMFNEYEKIFQNRQEFYI